MTQPPSEHSNPLNTRSPRWPSTGIEAPSSSRQHSNGPQKKNHRCGNRLKNTCRHSRTRLTQQMRTLVLRAAHQPSPCPSALSILLHHLVLLHLPRTGTHRKKRCDAMHCALASSTAVWAPQSGHHNLGTAVRADDSFAFSILLCHLVLLYLTRKDTHPTQASGWARRISPSPGIVVLISVRQGCPKL